MKKYILFALVLGLFNNCDGQDKPKQGKGTPHQQTSGNHPNVSVKVNRKYDSKGNLIRFDSTYSYHYSTNGRDSALVSLDTVFKYFKSDYPFEWRTDFESFFLTDSLAKYDFLNPDYFSKRFELNMDRMKERFRRMDSLKTRYLHEYRKK